jgi:hypothetical protein
VDKAWEQLIFKALQNSPFLSFPPKTCRKLKRGDAVSDLSMRAHQWKDDKDKDHYQRDEERFLPYDQRCDFIYSARKPAYAKERNSEATK